MIPAKENTALPTKMLKTVVKVNVWFLSNFLIANNEIKFALK
jgi:hypothetical protein